MSTLKTGALRGTSGSADSIQLHATNQSVTFPGDVTCSGTATGFGGGKINQILMYTDDANRDLSTGNSTWTQVPSMELAITTTNNNSKVMIFHHGTHFQDTADITAGATIYRDSTNLGPDEQGFQLLYGNNNDVAWQISINYLDTPGNAGTYTYKIYYKSDRNDGHYNQWGGRKTMSTLILWEVLP